MNTTQQHLQMEDIKDDLMILKNGGAALILQSSALNFGLLSEVEQHSVVLSFAQMLNSLSFPIQIMIYSQRLNINSYLHLLERARTMQRNPLLSQMIDRYKNFVTQVIKENDVLDKKFYVIAYTSSLEMGFGFKNKEARLKRAQAILWPRRDQLIRQLARVGLKANQLTSLEMLQLLYDIYNGAQQDVLQIPPVKLSPPPPPPNPPRPNPVQTAAAPPSQTIINQPKNHPFVVEELEDNV